MATSAAVALLLALAALCPAHAAAPTASASPHAESPLARWASRAPPRRELEPAATVTVQGDGAPLARSGAWVDVAFSGVAAPRSDDFVAYHVPAGATLAASAPVKFQSTRGKESGQLRCVFLRVIPRRDPESADSRLA